MSSYAEVEAAQSVTAQRICSTLQRQQLLHQECVLLQLQALQQVPTPLNQTLLAVTVSHSSGADSNCIRDSGAQSDL